MNDLTAIDILVEPDQTALARARTENERLRNLYPAGFSLDEHHTPHITILQRYVRTADLDKFFAAVEAVTATHDVSKLAFTATGIRYMPMATLPGLGIAAIVVTPAPEVLDLQSALIEAVRPFTGSGGTANAYVTTVEEPEINSDTLVYVERYVPDHSGANFVSHLTVGLAPLDDLTRDESAPFAEFKFHPARLAAYQLGNNGTAQQMLKCWDAI